MNILNPPVSLRLTPPLRRGARRGYIDYISSTTMEARGNMLTSSAFPLRGELPLTPPNNTFLPDKPLPHYNPLPILHDKPT